jgi:hypothetical protein
MFTNSTKLSNLHSFIAEYRNVVSCFIEKLYGKTKSGTFEGTSVDEIKRLVEQDFKTAFMYVIIT